MAGLSLRRTRQLSHVPCNRRSVQNTLIELVKAVALKSIGKFYASNRDV